MIGRNSNTIHNNLIEDDNSIVEPYYIKKAPVMFLLGKILYGVVITVLFGFGVYFLNLSSEANLSQDLIDFTKKSAAWNESLRSEFEDWTISIKNEKNYTIYLENEAKKMHQYDDSEKIYYNPIQKISKNMAPLISNIKLTKKKSDASSYSYNLTTNLVIELNNTFTTKRINLDDVDLFIRAPANKMKQTECVKNKGLWNYEDDSCYKYYMLRTLCIIFDQNTQSLFTDYKHFKCNGFNEWYESFSVFPWMIPSYDPNFDELEALNKKIGVYVSTNKDPYVWANYNGTLHFSTMAESYSVAGVWLITCAFALLLIPLLVYFKVNSPEENITSSPISKNNENFNNMPDQSNDSFQLNTSENPTIKKNLPSSL